MTDEPGRLRKRGLGGVLLALLLLAGAQGIHAAVSTGHADSVKPPSGWRYIGQMDYIPRPATPASLVSGSMNLIAQANRISFALKSFNVKLKKLGRYNEDWPGVAKEALRQARHIDGTNLKKYNSSALEDARVTLNQQIDVLNRMLLKIGEASLPDPSDEDSADASQPVEKPIDVDTDKGAVGATSVETPEKPLDQRRARASDSGVDGQSDDTASANGDNGSKATTSTGSGSETTTSSDPALTDTAEDDKSSINAQIDVPIQNASCETLDTQRAEDGRSYYLIGGTGHLFQVPSSPDPCETARQDIEDRYQDDLSAAAKEFNDEDARLKSLSQSTGRSHDDDRQDAQDIYDNDIQNAADRRDIALSHLYSSRDDLLPEYKDLVIAVDQPYQLFSVEETHPVPSQSVAVMMFYRPWRAYQGEWRYGWQRPFSRDRIFEQERKYQRDIERRRAVRTPFGWRTFESRLPGMSPNFHRRGPEPKLNHPSGASNVGRFGTRTPSQDGGLNKKPVGVPSGGRFRGRTPGQEGGSKTNPSGAPNVGGLVGGTPGGDGDRKMNPVDPSAGGFGKRTPGQGNDQKKNPVDSNAGGFGRRTPVGDGDQKRNPGDTSAGRFRGRTPGQDGGSKTNPSGAPNVGGLVGGTPGGDGDRKMNPGDTSAGRFRSRTPGQDGGLKTNPGDTPNVGGLVGGTPGRGDRPKTNPGVDQSAGRFGRDGGRKNDPGQKLGDDQNAGRRFGGQVMGRKFGSETKSDAGRPNPSADSKRPVTSPDANRINKNQNSNPKQDKPASSKDDKNSDKKKKS